MHKTRNFYKFFTFVTANASLRRSLRDLGKKTGGAPRIGRGGIRAPVAPPYGQPHEGRRSLPFRAKSCKALPCTLPESSTTLRMTRGGERKWQRGTRRTFSPLLSGNALPCRKWTRRAENGHGIYFPCRIYASRAVRDPPPLGGACSRHRRSKKTKKHRTRWPKHGRVRCFCLRRYPRFLIPLCHLFLENAIGIQHILRCLIGKRLKRALHEEGRLCKACVALKLAALEREAAQQE